MSDQNDVGQAIALLREIRDSQAAMAANQERALELMRLQAQDARERVKESIALQKLGIARQKQVMLGAGPLILLCLGLIGYLIWTYF